MRNYVLPQVCGTLMIEIVDGICNISLMCLAVTSLRNIFINASKLKSILIKYQIKILTCKLHYYIIYIKLSSYSFFKPIYILYDIKNNLL